jgi:hypothetical protein
MNKHAQGPRPVTAQQPFGSIWQGSTTTQQISASFEGHDRPQADLRLARESGTPRAGFRLAQGSSTPRADLCLARGSPSTNIAPHVSPDRGIKCSVPLQVPWSKGESSPRRSTDTAWESSPVTMQPVCRYAAIPGAVVARGKPCVDKLVSFQNTVSPTPVLLPRRAPRKGMGAPCRAYTPDTHARKDEDGLLLEFLCNPIRTHSI